MEIGNLHVFGLKEKRGRRYFAKYKIHPNTYDDIEARVEFAWGKKVSGPGISLHLGDRGSETPIDFMIGFLWVAMFVGLDFPGLGRFCEKIGRGHKRDISIRIFGGKIWWKLWYCDDMGYDDYHRCEKWEQPKIWPWSAGRRKYRSWMCLRDGCIDLNPLDALWGSRLYSYEDVQKKRTLVNVGEFENDQYWVDFTLQRQTRAREYGPSWVRRRSEQGLCAQWDCKDGIPFRNHEWKGDEVYGSSVKVDSQVFWLVQAVQELIDDIKRDRARHNYAPNN